ncbi:WD40-repeat-containing domain protein [Obelidium mucronatum]|nr:WD40-repeat-containing domain protein [Obelidium mucronatum]
MCGRSKISCLSWNSYIKNHLASSDYEGIVTLWDSNTGVAINEFEEHEKRTWSVDFNLVDPVLLASGSDDTKVKIWSTTQKAAVQTIESKANICSVKWNPSSNHQLAFGSADHNIHYYDLRKASEPLHLLTGHKKAVSYVKFLSKNELVSASTDSTLRLWDLGGSLPIPVESVGKPQLVRSYSGHQNEKNFVGLSINSTGEFISCGSENNTVYTYYNSLPKPAIVHSFGNGLDVINGQEVMDPEPAQFVSSVCWKRKSPDVLIAANSVGGVKVMQLI